MNTPIISISDDQNTITHESGVVTVFVETDNQNDCIGCIYKNGAICEQIKAPCMKSQRLDHKFGVFKLLKP
jgi:hypothetical protein